MRVLFFGDVVGRSGLKALSFFLGPLKEETKADFVIVNGENAALDGRGLTYDDYLEIYGAGADCVTLGNHFDRKGDILAHLDEEKGLVRPAGWLEEKRGLASRVYYVEGHGRIRVSNVLGQGMMDRDYASPYEAIDTILRESDEEVHFVDFHAESTSEKGLFAHYVAGRVSAVLGTHTHVQTSDERILEGHTAFISDIGMCGDYEGIIGFDAQTTLDKFIRGKRLSIRPGSGDVGMVNAVLIDVDEHSGAARNIERINRKERYEHQ